MAKVSKESATGPKSPPPVALSLDTVAIVCLLRLDVGSA